MTPSTNLANGANVTASGSGYNPFALLALVQCPNASSAVACENGNVTWGFADLFGNFRATVRVHTGAVGTGKCVGGGTCYIRVTNTGNLGQTFTAPITFAASAGGNPAIKVTPSTGLVDGTKVTVVGTGYSAFAIVGVVQCHDISGQAACNSDIASAGVGLADAYGTFQTSFTVHTGKVGNGTCAKGDTCIIAAANAIQQTEASAAGITFGPVSGGGGGGGGGGTPAISLSKATGVADGDSITVTGSGFSANATVGIVECADTSGQAACNTGGAVLANADATGAFSKAITVHTGTIGNSTCKTTCYISAGNISKQTENATKVFTFGGGTSPVTPAISLSKTTGVADGDSITVTGSGFTANATVGIVECADTSGQAACNTGGAILANADATGAFSKAITVHTGTIGNSTCKTTCYISAGNISKQTENATKVFTFTSSTSPVTPAISLSKTTGVADGESITVTGSGFTANATVAIVPCANTSGQAACNTNAFVLVNADASGAFTKAFTVHTGATGNGTCTTTCYLVAANIATQTETANKSFTFAVKPNN